MLGLILIIVLIWQVYKAAKESGRNGVLWAVGAFFGSVALQLLIGVALGIFFLIGAWAWGWPEDLVDKFTLPISLIATVINAVLVWMLIKWLSRVPEPEQWTAPPPPPTDFN